MEKAQQASNQDSVACCRIQKLCFDKTTINNMRKKKHQLRTVALLAKQYLLVTWWLRARTA